MRQNHIVEEQIIDLLAQVMRVSVMTMAIIAQMPEAERLPLCHPECNEESLKHYSFPTSFHLLVDQKTNQAWDCYFE